MSLRPLRIGIDAREVLGHSTGVGRYLAELLARWTRDATLAGHELVLFSPAALAATARFLGEGGARASVRVVPGEPGTTWEQWHLRRAAIRERLDVFFAPAYTAPLRLGAPCVVSVHDVSFAAHPEWFPWRQGLRRRWLTRWSACQARLVLTLTRFSRDEIVRHLRVPADRVRVVLPAVDAHPALRHAQARASGRNEPPSVLYVGSIFNRRHVPATIRAFGRVVRDVAGARLEIVGENRTFPPEDPGAVVRECGLQERVVLRDYVDDTTLETLFRHARAFVFLSEYEGFGLTPLEALARGVPAVVLDTPVAREAYGDAAIYVAAPDPDEVGAALVRVLTDEAWRRERSAAGLRQAARYSWDRAARETLDALVEAAG